MIRFISALDGGFFASHLDSSSVYSNTTKSVIGGFLLIIEFLTTRRTSLFLKTSKCKRDKGAEQKRLKINATWTEAHWIQSRIKSRDKIKELKNGLIQPRVLLARTRSAHEKAMHWDFFISLSLSPGSAWFTTQNGLRHTHFSSLAMNPFLSFVLFFFRPLRTM